MHGEECRQKIYDKYREEQHAKWTQVEQERRRAQEPTSGSTDGKQQSPRPPAMTTAPGPFIPNYDDYQSDSGVEAEVEQPHF